MSCTANHRSHALTDDAYIWQRHWNPSLRAAIADSTPYVHAWRVLAAEADPVTDTTPSMLLKVSVDRAALRRSSRPVIAVFRIDGRFAPAPLGPPLVQQVAAVASDWIHDGLSVRGIEIDYDCPTSRIADYRQFLHDLRAHLGPALAISITALPSWMSSRDLASLLSEVDEAVLQVHSVANPKAGLFSPALAMTWAGQWSALSSVPFRLALPTYWSQVAWDGRGRVVSIESEATRFGSAPQGRELVVTPREVSSTVAALHRSPPPHLIGIAWFRLPVADDGRAWSSHTWHAVRRGKLLQVAPPTVHLQLDRSGARDVYLRNESPEDESFPAKVVISASACEFADALPPYNLDRTASSVQFVLSGNNLLRAGEQRLIGWVRCTGTKPEGHASF